MHLEIRASQSLSDGRVIHIETRQTLITELDSTVLKINKAIKAFQKDEMPKEATD